MPHVFIIRRTPRLIGFTMIELLVVMVVLGLLISLVTAVAGKAIRQQKVRNTQQIMMNVTLALQQFAAEDPLQAKYGRKGSEMFGTCPPYQLAGDADHRDSVCYAVEPHRMGQDPYTPPVTLRYRLALDLSGEGSPDEEQWAVIRTPDGTTYPDGYDDSRALYTYFRVFSPESLNLIPEASIKPLYPQLQADGRSYVNSRGAGASQGMDGAEDILTIHDAWGVPLDYMMYVKVEWMLPTGGTTARFVVTERKPVLRSLGIKREVYDAEVKAVDNPTERVFDSSKWLFSEQLSSPLAKLTDGPDYRQGILDKNQASNANGWVRVVGAAESYAYLPDGDVEEP